MKKLISKAGKIVQAALVNAFDAVKKVISSIVEYIKNKDYRHPSYRKKGSITAYSRRAGDDETPVLGAPGDMKVRSAAVASRARRAAHPRKRSFTVIVDEVVDFFRTARLANKKRFSAVLCVALAAIMVPVIVVSANGGADNSVQELQTEVDGATEDVQTTVPLAAGQDVETSEVAQTMEMNGATVEEAEPTPDPEPSFLPLEPECTNDSVIQLQERLMELHYMDNDEPTDYYGAMTQQAIRYFQRKHGLTMDGYAGEETQKLLFSDNAQPYSVTVGAEGPDVSNIQDRLRQLGYDVGLTGYFGEETASAVQYFQRMNGLDADGSVGQYTKDILFSEDAERSEEYYQEQKESKSSGSGSKSSGSSGSSSSGSKSGSGSGSSGKSSTSHSADSGSVSAFIDQAQAQLGKPYVTGGKGPDSFDCSGLVYYALNQSGKSIGYMTSGGWASSSYPTVYSLDDLQPGDVICFSGHVAVYIGGGTMVDASSGNGSVVQRSCTGSWSRNNFICGKRPL